MWRPLRRIRGILVRLAHRRGAAFAAGAVLLGCGWLVRSKGLSGNLAVDQGIGIVLAATGLAFMLVGLAGRRPDWIDPD